MNFLKRAQQMYPEEFFFAEGEDFKPNEAMKAAAARGLEDRKRYGRGGTMVGVARARDIANGKNLSRETVMRMKSFFARHAAFKNRHSVKESDGGPTAAKISWDLWGGDAGAAWVGGILDA